MSYLRLAIGVPLLLAGWFLVSAGECISGLYPHK